jgi:hypothetical protein
MKTPDFRALCAELLDELDFQTSHHELIDLKGRARAALAEGAGVGPTDDSIETDFRVWFADTQGSAYFGAVALVVLIKWTRHLLSRYGTTHPRPIPVVERPWERPGFCDADGKCWWGRPSEELCNSDWFLATRAEVEEFCSDCLPIVCLPAAAIPLPAQEGADG